MVSDKSVVIVLLGLGTVLGLVVAIWASRRALGAAIEIGTELGVSPFFIGVTIMAVGTDLPEIANSIVASATDRGDLNVGDSIGSVVTQITLVLGILSLSGRLRSEPRLIVRTGVVTVVALLLGAVLIADDYFGRVDGAILIAAWIVGTLVIREREPVALDRSTRRSVARPVAIAIGALAVVGLGALVAVESFGAIASRLGAPEYLLSFFVLALGTSLPELVVDTQALRRAQGELAMGDLLGSSFVDATLSPGIGPLLFPTALSAGVARGNLVVAVVVAIVVVVLARSDVQTRSTGVILMLLYVGLYPALIT